MIDGIIIKGIGGFYYVKTASGIVESKARGVFREENIRPLIGDKVRIRISEEDKGGYIEEIYPRSSELLRPPVANVTQAIVVMSVKSPDINTWLLDKFIMMAENEGIDITVCFNKVDLDLKLAEDLKKIYNDAGYRTILVSSIDNIGIDSFRSCLDKNISVLAGPSGVGKSSLINKISPGLDLEIGGLSLKTMRGKHTTRHVELLEIDKDAYIFDTPGFSSLNLDFIDEESKVRHYFKEIDKYGRECKFLSCLHDKEPKCMVKEKVKDGIISEIRYNNYLTIMDEVKSKRRY